MSASHSRRVVGFTGTRVGMTREQRVAVCGALEALAPVAVHHGDCVGADAEFHAIAREEVPKARIVLHPPADPSQRAWCDGDESREVKPYLARDVDIVAESSWLIAAPRGFAEVQRSGTWATIRAARRLGRSVVIVWPDGSVEVEHQWQRERAVLVKEDW